MGTVSVYDRLLRPLLFRVDPETVHERALGLIASGLVSAPGFPHPSLHVEAFGVRFSNPLGLAAGFDKNGVALDQWAGLGFGFVEVGTVTWHPQPGNPKPRLFRLPEDHALINRLGFNNEGARKLALRLQVASAGIPVGINLGKSKVTELEDAPEDYAKSFGALRGLGEYFVINVSSPNTPGLRELQEKAKLAEIVQAIRGVDPRVKLFVKVAPDLGEGALDDILDLALAERLTGLIATNTTLSRDALSHDPNQQGGLSGAPLRKRADEVLAHLARGSQGKLVLIGVGGIMDAQDVYRKIALGAHLTQLYTGWVYGGPAMVPNTLRDLVGLMERDGVRSLGELRGSAL